MLKRAVRLSALLLLLRLPCIPQFEGRSVLGVVTDKTGKAVPGATVQLKNAGTLSIRSYVTNKDGHYHFNRLYDNVDYTVRAKFHNDWSKPKTLSKFDSSKRPQVDLIIPIE